MDGFYVAYITGHTGSSLLMIVIKDGLFVGADIGGMKYDGTIHALSGDSGYHCSIVYIVPAGTVLITGAPPIHEPQRIATEFDLPIDFANGRVVLIQTPLGPVNARFQKLRDLGIGDAK